MSSNIYENPNLTMNVRYSKGAGEDRGEREERVVDIYESINLPTQDGGTMEFLILNITEYYC